MNIQKVGDRIINIPRKTCLSPCGPEGNGILCYTASSLPLYFFMFSLNLLNSSLAKDAFDILLKLNCNPFSFVFASATHENGVAVYRRRRDNTLEASQVGRLNEKKL